MALFTLEELASWVQSDLDTATATLARDAATDYLEAETGVKLTTATDTITYVVRWDDCWIDLPVPTTEVTSVAVDGDTLASDDYQVVDNRLYRRVGWGGSRWLSDDRFAYRSSEDDYADVAVTLTYGFETPPGEFKTWGLVLAAQAYKLAPNVGVQSERIDDYSVTYATGTTASVQAGLSLPPQVLGKLKARYGKGAAVVNAR